MIDKKKIEEAAKEYSEKKSDEYSWQLTHAASFKTGVDWFKKNIWHDVKEAPLNDELLLIQRIDKHLVRYGIFTWDSLSDKWEEVKDNYNITKWCYLKDLI